MNPLSPSPALVRDLVWALSLVWVALAGVLQVLSHPLAGAAGAGAVLLCAASLMSSVLVAREMP
jgi:hypothetical protein